MTPLDEVADGLRRFVVLDAAQRDAIALWVAHTHALDAAHATPYLALTSAEMRSGKTRVLEVAELLVAAPLFTSSITEAALFRKVAKDTPTLLFDEVDAVFGPRARNHEGLRSLLNSGHRRGATATRVEGEGAKRRVEEFPVFCPKALAGIGSLPATVADRSIPVRLKRRAADEPIERFRRRDAAAELEPIRERLAAWLEPHLDQLTDARPDLPDELSDRAQDSWEPLFAIADLVGGDWPERARRAAMRLSEGVELDDESAGVRLLSDIRTVLDGRERIPTRVLVAALVEIEDAPWGDWYGKPLDARRLVTMLKRYQIEPRQRRFDGERAKGFTADDFADAFRRYLSPPPSSQTPLGYDRCDGNGGAPW